MNDLGKQPAADHLTQRERTILRLIAGGLSNQDIAGQLVISLDTVKWYLKQIYSKPGVNSRTQAIAAARTAELDITPNVALVAPSIAVPPHNLPQQPTPFIGRSKELNALARYLDDPSCRLVTLIGPGGIGKTRLALQAAEEHLSLFSHGVYFVSLAPLGAPESIVLALGEAIGFAFYPSGEPRQQLLEYLRAKQMLLLLDNFEHLLAGADLVAGILEAAPRVKILATSRERLNLQAEMVVSLDGMAYPAQRLPRMSQATVP